MKAPFLLATIPLFLALGCGGAEAPTAGFRKNDPSLKPPVLAAGPGAPAGADAPAAPPNQANGQPFPRKVIYTADIQLLVEDLSQAESQIEELIKEHQALIAHSDIFANPGAPRHGRWTVRVPADQFDDFLKGAATLGEVLQNKQDSEDITDKYYDSKIRVENKQKEVEGWRGLLQKAGDKPQMIDIKREVDRTTSELEQLKGMLRVWDSQIALSTVTLNVSERKGYTPPESPAFRTTVGRTFKNSVDALVAFGQGVVLVVVALTPWLPVMALVAAPVWWAVRRHSRRDSRRTAEVLPAEPEGRNDDPGETTVSGPA